MDSFDTLTPDDFGDFSAGTKATFDKIIARQRQKDADVNDKVAACCASTDTAKFPHGADDIILTNLGPVEDGVLCGECDTNFYMIRSRKTGARKTLCLDSLNALKKRSVPHESKYRPVELCVFCKDFYRDDGTFSHARHDRLSVMDREYPAKQSQGGFTGPGVLSRIESGDLLFDEASGLITLKEITLVITSPPLGSD